VSQAPLTVLFAPDSFKGSLTSVEVARALADGWARARPGDELLLSPLADGGEGTLEAIRAAGGWTVETARVHDPLRRQITARWLRSLDGSSAVVEMAEASGLSRVAPGERDAVAATSLGTGELIRAAAERGARRVIVGIGGSATTDGGRGLLAGLAGTQDDGTNASDGVALDAVRAVADAVDLEVACDVSNPLLGPHGAAATYGPQKGASAEQVQDLDRRLAEWAGELRAVTGRDEAETPGSGAAGGVGYALLAVQDAFGAFHLRPGIDLVMEATDFGGKLDRADLVITGEGRIDRQTAFGKTASGVAKRAAAAGVPCIAVGGGVTAEGIAALAELGVTVVPVAEHPQTVEDAMAAGAAPVERCGERIARLLSILAER
jgi:glycerate 2-kinase